MANFDFSTLSSSDLEELVSDLLNAKEKENKTGIIFKTFKDGKDKGIDFLFSTKEKQYEIVGQVKHYYRSGYDALLKILEKEEKVKIKVLNPNRYIVATSVDLSVTNTEEIKIVFEPYIQSLSDVIGKKELNKYLDLYQIVQENHFKLWFSSTTVLRKIINYQIEGRSNEFLEHDLKRRLRLYVEIPTLNNARKILRKNNFVIITGEPGTGKTLTSDILLYEFIKDDYELVYIYDDIKEAEKVLSNDEKKQVFYFDDFLGSTLLEIAKAKASETAIMKILKRISRLNNKKFILTTRTFLLNTAIQESEKLRSFNLKAEESIIKLSEYNTSIKLCLLNNHIEECELNGDLKYILYRTDIQEFIIQHSNFSPRVIEYITLSENIKNLAPKEYEVFIKNNLNNPAEIWRHAYEQQIDELDRLLLNTLLSFGDAADINELEIAFNSRLDYEVKFNNFQRPMHAFHNSFRKIEGGFIVHETRSQTQIKFINPSLVDFLFNYIKEDKDEVKRISEASIYLNQITTRFLSLNFIKKIDMPVGFKEKMLNNYSTYVKNSTKNKDRFTLVILLYYYFDLDEVEPIICDLLLKIDNWNFFEERDIRYNSIVFFEKVSSTAIIQTITKIGFQLFEVIILNQYDLNQSFKLMELIVKKFEINLEEILRNADYNHISKHFSAELSEKIDEDIEDLLGYSMAQDFVNEKETETRAFQDKFEKFGMNIKINLSEYNKYDWWEVGMDNYFQDQMAKDD